MKYKSAKGDWIKVDASVQPPIFRCDRCHKIMEIDLPASVDSFVKSSDAFVDSHKNCKQKKAAG